jgi:nicotinamidase-related amidase
MPSKNRDLHGNMPDKAEAALLLIDVINDLDFPEADELLKHALPMAKKLHEFKARAKNSGIPAVYVNDNFGRWRSDFRSLVEHCVRPEGKGREIVELLKPDDDDYFVLKPKHSGFFSTALDILLTYLEVRTVIIAGVATNICVLFTANDAYMRDYHLWVPRDCVAANTRELSDSALEQIAQALKADITASTEMRLDEILERRK